MIKTLTYEDNKSILVNIKNSTGYDEKFWNNGMFSDLAYLNDMKKNYVKESIVDVGSCTGNHTLFFVGIVRAPVHSFEPDKEKYNQLTKNIVLNDFNGSAKNYALSDYSGYAKIEKSPGIKFIRTTRDLWSCRVSTMDMLVYDIVSMIRIDVRSQEQSILSGARRIISSFLPEVYVRTEKPFEILL